MEGIILYQILASSNPLLFPGQVTNKSMVLVHSICHNKVTDQVAQTASIYFLQFRKLEVPDQGASLLGSGGAISLGFPGGSAVKNPPAMEKTQQTWVRPLGQEDPWRRKWQPTPVLLPGKSHEQKSLVGYSPWGRRESDMTVHARCSLWLGHRHLLAEPAHGWERVSLTSFLIRALIPP